MIITCYEEILMLLAVVYSSYYPDLETIIQSLSQGNAIIQHQWKSHAFSCIKPGIDYFSDKFDVIQCIHSMHLKPADYSRLQKFLRSS